MKRLVFALLVAICSAMSIGVILRTQDAPVIVDESTKLGLRPQETSDTLTLTASGELITEASGATQGSGMRARTVGMLDAVFYDANTPAPIVTQQSGKTSIKIARGLYLFATNDLFENYEITGDGFRLSEIAKGVFFVDTREAEIRFYSLSALLRITLTTDEQPVSDVNVFPSMLFNYNPTYNSNLANVDVFRIAQVNTLRIVDLSSATGPQEVFGPKSEDAQKLLDGYRAYVTARDARFATFYKAFQPHDDKNNLSLLDRYSMLFVNEKKKHLILENSLIASLQKLLLVDKGLCDALCLKSAGNQESIIRNITDRIESLGDMDPIYAEEARALVRRYIALSTLQTEKKTEQYFKWGQNPFVTLVTRVFGKSVTLDERYRLLSQMYSSYYFAGSTKEELAKNTESFIRYLVDGKSIGEKDFLSFVFFLKEYLTIRSNVIDATSVNTAYHMVRIADFYLASLKTDQEKFAGLSTLFYTFNTVFDGIHDNTVSRFFDGTLDNLTLKPEYLSGDIPKVSSDFITSYKKAIETLSDMLVRKRDEFYALIGTKQWDVTDNFVILSSTTAKLKSLSRVFTDYTEYRKNLTLNDATRNATGILLGGTKLSKEAIQTYMARFDGVDISTLQVLNDFEKDGFYDVRVTISGRQFSFQLREPGNILTALMYIDESGNLVDSFKQATISLDEREKLAKDKVALANTAEDRARYNFSNYFKATFFGSGENPTNTPTTPVSQPARPEMTPEMQLTVQHELIEKDFRNLATFAPIAIRNIFAKIENGVYDIDIFDVPMSVRGTSTIHRIELSSKYIFTDQVHAFSGINLKIQQENMRDGYRLWWVAVKIFPMQINLAEFQQVFTDIGPYLDTITQQNINNPQSVTIDISNKQTIINGTAYPVTFKK